MVASIMENEVEKKSNSDMDSGRGPRRPWHSPTTPPSHTHVGSPLNLASVIAR